MNSTTRGHLSRRRFLIGSLVIPVAASAVAACAPAATAQPSPTVAKASDLRIGYQKGGGVFLWLKNQKTLEKKFGSAVNVSWLEFSAGPPILEAMNSGTVDLATTGETPPIFAEAAGTPLLYVATTFGSGAGQGLLVPETSPIKAVADLKGKKVAFNKASSAHLFIVRALEKNGLQYTDIQPTFLAPADARAAFQGGSIDAWVIWDPYYSAAQQELQAKVILDGKNLAQTRSYYLASETFTKSHPDILKSVIQELQSATTWSKTHTDEYAQILANETGLDVAVWKQALQVDNPDVTFIDDATVTYQQKVADTFLRLGLIPSKLVIKQAAWYGDKA
jgi:sulfonate transport system substrate-binding protein